MNETTKSSRIDSTCGCHPENTGFSYSLQVLQLPQNSSCKLTTTWCFWYLLALHLYLNELIITDSSISQICVFIFWHLHFNISIPFVMQYTLFSTFWNLVLSKGPLSSPDAKRCLCHSESWECCPKPPLIPLLGPSFLGCLIPIFIHNKCSICHVPDTLESLATQTHVC